MSPSSDKQWYYAQSRQRFGPVTAHVLAQMYAQGELRDEDLVWAPHMQNWQKAGLVKEEFMNAPPPPPQAAAPSAYASPVDPLPTARPMATGRVAVDDSFENGGFFARAGAFIVDAIILIPIQAIVGAIMGGIMGAMMGGVPQTEEGLLRFQLVIQVGIIITVWLYYALQESGGYGATFGKRALGISVTDLNGDSISFARASARHFSKIVSAAICGLGYFFPFFTQRKQALHDIIAGCMIIK